MTTRTQLVGSILATLLGIVAVTGYGWRALGKASDAAERSESYLAQIGTVADIEEKIHILNASRDARTPKMLAELDRTVAALRQIEWESEEDRELAIRLAKEVAGGRLDRAAQIVSVLEKRAIDRSKTAIFAETQAPARERAGIVVGIGTGVVLVFGLLSTFVLLRYLKERRHALQALRRSERLAALGTIAASMAHELNNPLGTIGGCASAVRTSLKKHADDHEYELEYLEMIESETRRCSGIVGSLGDLARDAPPAITTARLDDIAREVARLVKVDPGPEPIVIEVEAEPELEILCDPDKIKQLLLNLIVNARDACGEGGHVRVEVRREGDAKVGIVVTDDGKGVAAKDLPLIFEPFHSQKPRGLGLGLFLCERIVSLHGGSIRATSEGRGRGTRFEVQLPAG